MTAIFQPQISSLESQLFEIQAKIAAFAEAEFVADGAIQALRKRNKFVWFVVCA